MEIHGKSMVKLRKYHEKFVEKSWKSQRKIEETSWKKSCKTLGKLNSSHGKI